MTANYRLGLLGAGNNFLRDQITAFEWGAIPYRLQTDPRAASALSSQMRCAWTSFVRTGNPGWPGYRSGRITKVWNTPPSLVFAPGEAERAAWDAFDFRHFQ